MSEGAGAVEWMSIVEDDVNHKAKKESEYTGGEKQCYLKEAAKGASNGWRE